MSNYKTLFILRILKSTIEIFVNSFFVMYFLDISDQNIFGLGVYYIFVYLFVYLTIYSLRNYCNSKGRINLLRVGIVLNLIYFLLIIFLKEKLIDYIYLMAIIYGLEEGFYYSVYNNFESFGIKNKDRAHYSGIYTLVKSIIAIIIPILFGSIITKQGFLECTIVIVILVILQIIFSFIFKDISKIDNKKVDMKFYKNKILVKYPIMKKMHNISFINGIIYTGAFSSIVTLYIIKSSIELGIFSSIFAIISGLLGFFFAKILPRKKYKVTIIISGLMTILGLIILIYKVSLITVVVFNLMQTFSATLTTLIIDNQEIDMTNYNSAIKSHKVEYFVYMEKNIFWG